MTERTVDLAEYARSLGIEVISRYGRREQEKRRDALIVYVMKNPDCKRASLVADGHEYALSKFYRGRLNRLKIELGLKTRNKYTAQEWEQRIREMKEYVAEHPNFSASELIRMGYSSIVNTVYNGRTNDIRREMGLPERGRGGNNNPRGIKGHRIR